MNLDELTDEQIADLAAALRPRLNQWIVHEPHPKQAAFLLLDDVEEVMFGGAGGGGKSDVLLAGAAQYVDVPDYAGVIFRRTYTDLSLPGALMDRAHDWWGDTAAQWSERDKTWQFPGGGSITFAYMEALKDRFRYRSAEFQYVAFDELTEFHELQYTYLFSRLRRPSGLADNHPLSRVPIRMRSATNPGGSYEAWVYERFVAPWEQGQQSQDRIFLPAKLTDNPSVDADQYRKSLSHADDLTRQQILDGVWGLAQVGGTFERDGFRFVKEAPAGVKWVRWWDLAATEAKGRKDPDWTAGGLVGIDPETKRVYVGDVARTRAGPGEVEQFIRTVAEQDGRGVPICIEEEGGASGKNTTHRYATEVLAGFDVKGIRVSGMGKKELRIKALASQVNVGNVYLVGGEWVRPFLNEAIAWPKGAHDDQVDAVGTGWEYLRYGMGEKQKTRVVPGALGVSVPIPHLKQRS